MINQDCAPGANSREFIDLMEAAIPGPLPGILHLFKAHGLGGGLRVVGAPATGALCVSHKVPTGASRDACPPRSRTCRPVRRAAAPRRNATRSG